MKLLEAYQQGQDLLEKKRSEDNAAKSQDLRGGNSGCIVHHNGETHVLGACPRKTLLRLKGHDSPIDFATSIMFAGGHGNEANWLEKLGAFAAANNLIIKAESDYPLTWALPSGRIVSGSPDAVLLDKDMAGGEFPILGIELKAVCALNTFKGTILNGEPKTDNVIQTAHYLNTLRKINGGANYKLVYTSYVNFPISGYYVKDFPRQGQPGSHLCEYNAKGEAKTARPAIAVYDVDITKDGAIDYRREEESAWTRTLLTVQGIKDFYAAVDTMEADADLGPRPNQITCTGGRAPYSICNYCDLGPLCDAYEGAGFHTWLKQCTKLLPKRT